jgi:hypothetical protein
MQDWPINVGARWAALARLLASPAYPTDARANPTPLDQANPTRSAVRAFETDRRDMGSLLRRMHRALARSIHVGV